MPSIQSISSSLKLILFKNIQNMYPKAIAAGSRVTKGGKKSVAKRPKLWECHYSVEGEVVDIQDRESSVVFIFHHPLFRLLLLEAQAIPAGVTHKSIQHGQDTLLSEKEIVLESDRRELESGLHHSPVQSYYTDSHFSWCLNLLLC